MKINESIQEVVSIWGLISLLLVKLVAPMPTTNRWLTKMGESTNNQRNYGISNLLAQHRLERSLSLHRLSSN